MSARMLALAAPAPWAERVRCWGPPLLTLSGLSAEQAALLCGSVEAALLSGQLGPFRFR